MQPTEHDWFASPHLVSQGDLVTIGLPNSVAFYEASIALWKGIIVHDFNIEYVASYTARNLPEYYLTACERDGTPYDFEAEKYTAKGRRIWVRCCGEVRSNVIRANESALKRSILRQGMSTHCINS